MMKKFYLVICVAVLLGCRFICIDLNRSPFNKLEIIPDEIIITDTEDSDSSKQIYDMDNHSNDIIKLIDSFKVLNYSKVLNSDLFDLINQSSTNRFY